RYQSQRRGGPTGSLGPRWAVPSPGLSRELALAPVSAATTGSTGSKRERPATSAAKQQIAAETGQRHGRQANQQPGHARAQIPGGGKERDGGGQGENHRAVETR